MAEKKTTSVKKTPAKKKATTKKVTQPLKASAQLTGIDISEWQGSPNWDALRQAVDFVVFRSSFGTARADNSFAYNRDNARSRGMLRGFYHYAYPEYNSPESEAQFFIDTVGAMQHGEILMLDFEESKFTGDYDDWAVRFLIKAEQLTGVKPLLYTYAAMERAHTWGRTIANGNGLWLASYTFDPNNQPAANPWPFAAFFQYTDKASVAGMAVDGDVFHGDSTAFQAYGYQGAGTNPTPVPSYIATAGTATVTNDVAWVRSQPNHTSATAGSVSLNKGDQFNFIGYVLGEDPYGDGRNIWLVTHIGSEYHYVWEYATNATVGQSAPTPTPVITTQTVVTTQSIDFAKKFEDDATLDLGVQKVLNPGQAGTDTLTYTVTYTDGVESNRVLTSTDHTVLPVDEIIAVGTKPAPTPTPDPTPAPVTNDPLVGKIITWIVNLFKSIFKR